MFPSKKKIKKNTAGIHFKQFIVKSPIQKKNNKILKKYIFF